jgi:hypothetical protein
MFRVLRDPVLALVSLLSLLSVPAIIELLHHYPTLDQREVASRRRGVGQS